MTVLFGGPPCQGFSTSNQKTRNSDNPDNWLFEEYIRIVRLCRPDWVVFENVKGIIDTEGGIFFDHVLKRLKRAGYIISWWVLNSSGFGVPQYRNRLFVIGSLHGVVVAEPKPTIKKPPTNLTCSQTAYIILRNDTETLDISNRNFRTIRLGSNSCWSAIDG